jgi:RNA polymerase sigma factor for flagellar operon FliA
MPDPLAENELESCIPIVRQEAYRLKMRLPERVETEELISSGLLGLTEAKQRFDPSLGVPFRAFVRRRIKGAMLDYLRSLDILSTEMRQRVRNIEAIEDEFFQKNGRTPSFEEVQDKITDSDIESSKRLSWARNVRVHSLEEANPESGFLADEKNVDVFSVLEISEALTLIKMCLSKLKKKEQQFFTLYYQEELTLKEIALIFGVSESRISQIHKKCLCSIRQELKGLEHCA